VIARAATLIRDGLVIGGAAAFLLSIAGAGAWTFYGGRVAAFLRTELGIDALSDQIRTLAGEDRIIRQPRGYSYVEEPVHVGEKVFLVLHMARTQSGIACSFVRASSIFEDQRGIKLGGSSIGPITQLGTNPEAIRVGLDMPQGLQTGRVGVHLVLEYRCGGETAHDKTDTLFFELLP
jgi:hypothetical protein